MRNIVVFFTVFFGYFLYSNGHVFLQNISNSGHLIKKNVGFFFTTPKTLLSGRNESVCLSLHNFHHPAKALIDLKWKGNHFLTSRTLETDHTCFNMHVPKRNLLEPHYVSIKVQVMDGSQVQTSHNLDPVLLYPEDPSKIFVETDREMYKPGDLIKIRTLALNEYLLPGSSKIPEAHIKNPLDVNVFVWDNISLDHGMANLEYQLVNEAMTGKWKIEVGKTTKLFEVSKYVIPKYKIDLTYPKSVYYKTNSITISVCARYSFNQPVLGMAFVKIRDSVNHMETINKLQEMHKGCSHFYITKEELNLSDISRKFSLTDPKIYLHINATVTEQGTTKIDVTSGKSEIHLKGYTLKFQSSSIFIPGVPYEGQLKVVNAITDIRDEVVELCYNLAIKKSWNYFNNEQCKNYTVPEDGVVPFKLWPLRNSVLHIHLNAKSVNNTNIEDSFLAVRLYSPSSSYIYIESESHNNRTCLTHYQYKVLYTTDHFKEGQNITFYYMVRTNSELYKMRRIIHTVKKHYVTNEEDNRDFLGVEHKFVKLGASIDHFLIKFKIEKIAFRYQILVYYVTNDGETVATSRAHEIKPCSFKIEASWNENHMVPGRTAKLNIKSEQKGLCAVTATDKASSFLTSSQQDINWDQIAKGMFQQRESPKSARPSCVNIHRKVQVDRDAKEDCETMYWHNCSPKCTPFDISALTELGNLTSLRTRRHIFSFSEDYDSYDVFNKFGVVTISNLKVVTKPCYSGPLFADSNEAEFMTDQYNSDLDEGSEVTVRSYFPENWLWELIPVENTTVLERELPHSITTWMTNVFCVSITEGVSFAPLRELTSFQPFFLEVLSPYSIKKEEHFYLPINVFNYLNYSFPIRISLRLSDNLQLTNTRSLLTASYCLKEANTITHNYQISATVIGTAQITVSVETDNQYPLPCGPEIILSKRDAVLKTVIIEPEGFKEVKTNSALLCSSGHAQENGTTWNVNMPTDIVPDTNKTFVIVNADLLGATIENLKQLITIPTGCGEQIMASLAPNLHILRYMNTTETLTQPIKQRIIRSFKIGYQRILNYMHKDGSFSAFGYHDPAGSMFLTTFVVKVLQQIKQYVYVEQRVIDKAIEWIYSNQLENGCFDAMYHVFHDMGGTDTERSTSALTSYVILSLLEAKIEIPESIQANAKYCIRNQGNPDKYSLVISCYAMFQMRWISEGIRFLEHILATANKGNNMMWWSFKDDDQDHASDIEITSYALLSLMHQKTSINLAHAHSIVRWLSSKIGPTGAFKSTQDSVVALEALTVYAEYIQSHALNLNINIISPGERHSVTLTKTDRLKAKRISLRMSKGKVEIGISGKGCALVQLIESYHSLNVPKSEDFKLAVDVTPVSNVDKCSMKKISPCVTYSGQSPLSNMAVMEIGLPSGYIADKASLDNLIETGNYTRIKMFEETDNQINLYFTKLDKSQLCFSFSIMESTKLEYRKENIIKIYDYYNPEQIILQFYKISNNCSEENIERFETKVNSLTSINKTDDATSNNNSTLIN